MFISQNESIERLKNPINVQKVEQQVGAHLVHIDEVGLAFCTAARAERADGLGTKGGGGSKAEVRFGGRGGWAAANEVLRNSEKLGDGPEGAPPTGPPPRSPRDCMAAA